MVCVEEVGEIQFVTKLFTETSLFGKMLFSRRSGLTTVLCSSA